MFGLMSRAEHERILAEGQERARATIAKANAERDALKDRMAGVATASIRREAEVMRENDALKARLAKSYIRNAKGQIEKVVL